MTNHCTICSSDTTVLHDPQLKVFYHVCDHCGFIYKDPQFHLSHEQELEEYNQHDNSFESKGYVAMFERFINDYIRPLNLSGVGLEFGSGPGPVLKELLTREGYQMHDYDYFYNPNEDYKQRQYDFITSTEVVEHFTTPLQEFTHLTSLLKDGGYLIVMTQFNTYDTEGFLQWWYRREQSHISFYSVKTIQYLAKILDMTLIQHNNKNVFILQKQTTQ